MAWVKRYSDQGLFVFHLFAPQALTSGRPTGHALSWFTGRRAGHEYLCHAGGGPGYGAEIRVYPALGAASALLTNTTMISDARLLDRLDAQWLGSAPTSPVPAALDFTDGNQLAQSKGQSKGRARGTDLRNSVTHRLEPAVGRALLSF